MTDQVAPAPAADARPIPWAYWLWVAVCLVVGTAVFFPILVHNVDPDLLSLVDMWESDDDYSYGYLIPPLALYFVWENRARLQGLRAEGSAWGLPVLGLALVMLMVGMLGGINFLPRVSAIVCLFGAILWIGGLPWARALLFPVGFLLLMIPIPEFVLIQISFPLQIFAAQVAEELLFLVNVPMLREGNVITLANTRLEVAEACSGLRSLLALVTTGVTFAYFFARSLPQRLLIVASSIPIAIAVNALRVAGTGWLAHHYGADVATGYYHTLEGFVMFGLAFLLLAIVGFLVIAIVPGGRSRPKGEEA